MADLTNLERGTVISKMTFEEARQCADEIKTGINSIGRKLLQLYEGAGWEVLGYSSWRECAKAEFGYSQSYAYRLLSLEEVRQNLTEFSPIGEKCLLPTNESQARPLTTLPPEAQRTVWAAAVESAPNGKVTAAHVQETVETYQSAQGAAVRLFNESVIDAGLQTFVHVGNALREIRDTRLYRHSHATFEDFCLERWKIEQSYADELIDFAQVIGN